MSEGKIPRRIISGWGRRMTSSSENGGLSSSMARLRDLRPFWGRRPPRRSPPRSPRNFRRRTFTSSWPRKITANGFPNNWWRPGSRSAGRPAWSPSGPDYTATVFAMGFATRAAMSFGGIAPGDYRKILIYNKDRVFAFALPLGFVTDEWYANAAGSHQLGIPGYRRYAHSPGPAHRDLHL